MTPWFWSKRSHRSAWRRRPALARHRCRPILLTLEDRTLLSTLTVTNLSDADPGSLRAAITQAAAGYTIAFADSLNGTITLTSGVLAITKDLTIVGPGASQITVSGSGNTEVLNVAGGVTASIAGLSIVDGGNVPFGGGIYSGGNLTITDSILSGNAALYGGAVYTRDGTLTVTNDTFVNNVASAEAGAIDNWAGGTVVATNDAFSGNSAPYGGAIGNEWARSW